MTQVTHHDFEPTFDFELNDLRQRTVSNLQHELYDEEVVNDLLASDDPVEHLVGNHLQYRFEHQSTDSSVPLYQVAISGLAEVAKQRIDLNILASRNPMTDAVDGSIVDAKLDKVKTFSDLLKAEFGSKFIGIVVAGSLARGYADRDSDADIAIIGQDPAIAEFAIDHADEFGVEHFDAGENYVHCDPDLVPEIVPYETDAMFNPLFQGIFNGNRARLEEIQSKFLGSVSPDDWDKSRMRMLHSEMASRHKRGLRLDITMREDQNVLFMSLLQRVPPRSAELRS